MAGSSPRRIRTCFIPFLLISICVIESEHWGPEGPLRRRHQRGVSFQTNLWTRLPLPHYPVGTRTRPSQETQTDGKTWYFDASSNTRINPPCWVYGPSTAALNVLDPDRLRLAILDHILARKEVKLDEYVEFENFLNENTDSRLPSVGTRMPGLLRFRLPQRCWIMHCADSRDAGYRLPFRGETPDKSLGHEPRQPLRIFRA